MVDLDPIFWITSDLCWCLLQDKLVNGKKPDSDSPPREKPTVESVEAARAKLAATAVRIQQKCLNVNQAGIKLENYLAF